MMHVCGALFMFVHGDRFMNPGADPACPARGLSFWLMRQGGGVLGEEIAETEGKITALDGANVRHEVVMSATRVKLTVVVGPRTTATETGTPAFALHFGGFRIFRDPPPLRSVLVNPINEWEDCLNHRALCPKQRVGGEG